MPCRAPAEAALISCRPNKVTKIKAHRAFLRHFLAGAIGNGKALGGRRPQTRP
jgi:hypothetical protein